MSFDYSQDEAGRRLAKVRQNLAVRKGCEEWLMEFTNWCMTRGRDEWMIQWEKLRFQKSAPNLVRVATHRSIDSSNPTHRTHWHSSSPQTIRTALLTPYHNLHTRISLKTLALPWKRSIAFYCNQSQSKCSPPWVRTQSCNRTLWHFTLFISKVPSEPKKSSISMRSEYFLTCSIWNCSVIFLLTDWAG